MDALRTGQMPVRADADPQKLRNKAVQVAAQFEEVFVRSLVGSLRSTSGIGGEDGGMFGSGPGADTYADWFDERIAGQIASTGGIGIADSLLRQMEKNGELPPAPPAGRDAAPGAPTRPATTGPRIARGGLDVVL